MAEEQEQIPVFMSEAQKAILSAEGQDLLRALYELNPNLQVSIRHMHDEEGSHIPLPTGWVAVERGREPIEWEKAEGRLDPATAVGIGFSFDPEQGIVRSSECIPHEADEFGGPFHTNEGEGGEEKGDEEAPDEENPDEENPDEENPDGEPPPDDDSPR